MYYHCIPSTIENAALNDDNVEESGNVDDLGEVSAVVYSK